MCRMLSIMWITKIWILLLWITHSQCRVLALLDKLIAEMAQLINILNIIHLFTVFKITLNCSVWCHITCAYRLILVFYIFPFFFQEEMMPGAILRTFKLMCDGLKLWAVFTFWASVAQWESSSELLQVKSHVSLRNCAAAQRHLRVRVGCSAELERCLSCCQAQVLKHLITGLCVNIWHVQYCHRKDSKLAFNPCPA